MRGREDSLELVSAVPTLRLDSGWRGGGSHLEAVAWVELEGSSGRVVRHAAH